MNISDTGAGKKRRYIKIIMKIVLFIFLILIFNKSLLAHEKKDKEIQEENMDELFLGGGENENREAAGEKWDIFGYFESENFFSIGKFTDGERPHQNDIVKFEERARLNTKYGNDFFYGKASFDAYLYAHQNKIKPPRKSGTVDVHEFYVAYGEKLQLKAGKQVFNWGSADVFRIVNYSDQKDLRELFLIDEDERYRGVYALDIKYLFSDYSFEAFVIPSSARQLLPGKGTFWEMKPKTEAGLPIIVISPDTEKSLSKNASYGMRSGGTFGPVDMYLSYFQGENNQMIFYPEIYWKLPLILPWLIVMNPDFSRVNKIGLDFAVNIQKLALRGEAVYTPDQPAIPESTIASNILWLSSTDIITRPRMERVPYFSYTIGADYNLWGEYGLFLVEYSSSHFIANDNKYQKDFFSNILFIALEDKFYESRLKVGANFMLRLSNDGGWVPGLNIAYDFKNGIIVSAGFMLIYGQEDEMLSMYENHDIFYAKARIEF